MGKKIANFPKMTKRLKREVLTNIDSDKKFKVKSCNNTILDMEYFEEDSNEFRIVEKKGSWNPDKDDIYIQKKYSIKNCDFLFGENGIVCEDAVLGLGISWFSRETRVQGSTKILEFKKGAGVKRGTFEHEIKAGIFRGSIEYELIIYIEKEGNPKPTEAHFANEKGIILGELEKRILKIDGDSSEFPIYNIYEKNGQLWYLELEWSDPREDQFCDCVRIKLNKANSSYKYISDKNSKQFIKSYMDEIMTSAMNILIQHIKDSNYWEDTIKNIDLLSGSVSSVVYYYIKYKKIKYDSSWDIYSSLREVIGGKRI